MRGLNQRLSVLERSGTGGQHFNVVVRWVGADHQALRLTRMSDQMTVHRHDGESESDFQDRAAAILGGEQWQVPEFALPSDVTSAFTSLDVD